MTRAERVARVERPGPLPVVRPCHLLALPRSTVYYPRQAGVDAADETLMRHLDQLHLRYPFYGARRLREALRATGGVEVNRKRIQRLMRLMGLEALYPRPRTSHPHLAHPRYPYLLRGLTIHRPDQVWCSDLTYIPMRKGFLYLVVIMDWHSRAVLSHRLSNTLDTEFCREALEEAFAKYGTPQIFNTDQGCQFTSQDFLQLLQVRGVKIRMDGKGRWLDKVFVERLWRSLKYEEVYLNAYETVAQARAGIAAYLEFFTHRHAPQSLAYQTPWAVYQAGRLARAA